MQGHHTISFKMDLYHQAGLSQGKTIFGKGTSTSLSCQGGTLSPGAEWIWYTKILVVVFQLIRETASSLAPHSTNYYVRAEGGNCNTSCASIFINVFDAQAYFVPFDTLCGLTKPFLLTGGMPGGGIYSGTGVINEQFHPATAGYLIH